MKYNLTLALFRLLHVILFLVGRVNKTLIYDDGEITLIYNKGKDKCHGKYERRTIIHFVCDHKAYGNDGPTYLNETDSCDYVFSWPTSLACPTRNYQMASCSLSHGGHEYSLHELTLTNDNYMTELHTSTKRYQFVINICSVLVHKKGRPNTFLIISNI